MKFVHIADIHLDKPFTSLERIDGLSNKRRLEQRQAIKKVIEYIKLNDIPYLFISGDLYEHEYIRQSTIEYINELFKTIPETKIYIAPGNHDPYLKNSYYNKFDWSKNVHIFTDKIEKISSENIDIYGCGFTDFYMKDNKIKNIKIEDKSKINILVIHGSLDGGWDDYREYNPMSRKELELLDFNYIALGHIHKPMYNEKGCKNIVYPGSTISLGFDELGDHGMIVGDITKDEIETNFIKIDEREFVEKEIDISEIISEEELIETLNCLDSENSIDNKLYKIILVGKRKIEINIYNIYKILNNDKIMKIKDLTKLDYDLSKIESEESLKGLFVKELLEKLENEENEKNIEIINRAIQMGLDVLEG